MLKPQYKIIAQVFQNGGCYFRVEDGKSKELSLHSTASLMANPAIFQQFSQRDCFLIGYAEAQNQQGRIRREMDLFRKKFRHVKGDVSQAVCVD